MHAPTASQVRSSVPRLALYATQSGATMRWSQQLCRRLRRTRPRSRGRDLVALNAPGRTSLLRSRVQRNTAHVAVAAHLGQARLRRAAVLAAVGAGQPGAADGRRAGLEVGAVELE